MQNLQSVYLDTSAINFLFANDAPEKMEITKDFFDNFILPKRYSTFISEFVVQEINQTNNSIKREELLGVLLNYPIEMLTFGDDEKVEELANAYINHEIIPKKKKLDALHVAVCVILGIDYLASWNYKHLANVNRERKIISLNMSLGYLHPIRIVTPAELIFYEN